MNFSQEEMHMVVDAAVEIALDDNHRSAIVVLSNANVHLNWGTAANMVGLEVKPHPTEGD